MGNPRPSIPEATKRAVRQRCGFGCVICGVPVYHYDHMVEWAEVKAHEEENIVLLCPNHHQDKTSGRLNLTTLRRYAAKPKNLATEWTAPHVHIAAGATASFQIGHNVFKRSGGYFTAIGVKGETLLGAAIQDEEILFDIHLVDGMGRDVLKVVRNELQVSLQVWDYRAEGPSFQVRTKQGDILLALRLEGSSVTVERGLFLRDGQGVRVADGAAFIIPSGPELRGNYVDRTAYGILID